VANGWHEPWGENGDASRLEVPLLGSSPSFAGPGGRLSLRGARVHELTVHRSRYGSTKPCRVALGHDQLILYLAVSIALDPESYDTYLSVYLDCHLNRRPEFGDIYNGLVVGVAGPRAWEGYNYHHFDGEHLAEPTALQRASWAGGDGAEFRLAIPLVHSNVMPNGRLAICLSAGEDGQTSYHYPTAPGEGGRWATAHLQHHWSVTAEDHSFGLSRREREVLQALADLGCAEAAGERLALSRRTVERHLENIRHKMRRNSSIACVVEALRYGLIA